MCRLSSVTRSIGFLARLFWTCLFLSPALAGDGDLDPSFGDNGRLYFIGDPFSYDELVDICLQPDGKIIGIGVNRSVLDVIIARFNSDGTFDSTFGSGGRERYDSRAVGYPEAGILLRDGKYFIVGYQLDEATSHVMMMRLKADGALDTSFGKGGVFLLPGKFANDVLQLPDGRIVVGAKLEDPADDDFAVICLQPSGSLDAPFGDGGILRVDFGSNDTLGELALMPDGRLLAAGLSDSGSLLICMLTATGSLDRRFGSGGKVEIRNVAPSGPSPWPSSGRASVELAVQLDGRIVVGTLGGSYNFIVAGLNPDGSLDSSFQEGEVSSWTAAAQDYRGFIYDLAVQADGKIIAAGQWAYDVEEDFLLSRYHSDGTPDFSFGASGWVATDFPRYRVGGVYSAVIQPDGKILAGGYGPDPDHRDTVDMALARYLSSIDPDGALAVLAASFKAVSPPAHALIGLVEEAGRDLERGRWRSGLNALSDLEERVRLQTQNGRLAPEHGRRALEVISSLKLGVSPLINNESQARRRREEGRNRGSLR